LSHLQDVINKCDQESMPLDNSQAIKHTLSDSDDDKVSYEKSTSLSASTPVLKDNSSQKKKGGNKLKNNSKNQKSPNPPVKEDFSQ